MRALVTGATGFLGRSLLKRLDRPVVLSRRPEKARQLLGDVEAYAWQPEAGLLPAEALRGIEWVFNLAGEPVAEGRWTAAKKQRIRTSRICGTRALVSSMAALEDRPRVLISASAVGYYGARGDEPLDETGKPGSDFLAEVCQAWEAEAERARELGIRVVTPRIGIVLGRGGGALGKMLTPFKLGLGGRLGDGRFWMPWVHLDDVVGLLMHAAESHEVSGPVNAVAPSPATNAEFTSALASVLHRPAIFPVPAFALRLVLGEITSALLASQKVVPRVAERTDYRFNYPSLEEALREAISAPAKPDQEPISR